jgi:hypothetical protein
VAAGQLSRQRVNENRRRWNVSILVVVAPRLIDGESDCRGDEGQRGGAKPPASYVMRLMRNPAP